MYRLNFARNPFFGEKVVRSVVVTVRAVENFSVLLAADIYSLNPVPFEENRLSYYSFSVFHFFLLI